MEQVNRGHGALGFSPDRSAYPAVVAANRSRSFSRTFAHSGTVVNDKGGNIFIVRHGCCCCIVVERDLWVNVNPFCDCEICRLFASIARDFKSLSKKGHFT
jgi:hypothetical protein